MCKIDNSGYRSAIQGAKSISHTSSIMVSSRRLACARICMDDVGDREIRLNKVCSKALEAEQDAKVDGLNSSQ